MTIVEVEELRRTHRATWAAGDYAAVADGITFPIAPHLVDRVGVSSGEYVLDVATGTGNVALVAAQAGADVVGLDLTPELFDAARRRADEAGVAIEWLEGDAESLPFDDATFDVIFSALGVQFVPRHQVTAEELVRVCKDGGSIALANWTPEGQVGDMFKIMGRYLPPSPSYASPAALWGSEEYVRELFKGAGELELERATLPLMYDSAEDYVAFMETAYGPMVKARERLTSEGRWDECRSELVEMMERRNEATDGTLFVPAEYLIAILRKS
jgi:SAM-dependent methyltransferase